MNTKELRTNPCSAPSGTPLLVPIVLGFLLAAAPTRPAVSGEEAIQKAVSGEILRAAAKDGTLAFRLTTPDELEQLVGKPQDRRSRKDGDMSLQVLEFPGVTATFGRMGELVSPFTLFELQVDGRTVDIGRGRQVVLRTVGDLAKLDLFWGLAGVSLARLDLRDQLNALNRLTFDTRTVWPGADKLPVGFDPARRLEEGKNPGLGVRKLHAAGIDGRGVGIAIMDQPLLREHEEYKDRIVTYTQVDAAGVEPRMHGPAVASIAVGRHCGVAPGAALYYFAVPSWKWPRTEPWAEQLERIIEENRKLTDTPKIRVVSLSLGAFSQWPNQARWQQAVQKAMESDILVVTCDADFLRLATLKRIESCADPAVADYARGLFGHPSAALCVPAANRTLASFWGPRCYTYDRLGGMSWTVPYLAGVAALALQIDPSIKPREMVELWKRTAAKTPSGPVIDPVAMVEAIVRDKPTRQLDRERGVVVRCGRHGAAATTPTPGIPTSSCQVAVVGAVCGSRVCVPTPWLSTGANGRGRTDDLRFTKPLLCH